MWNLAITALKSYALQSIAGLTGIYGILAKIALKYILKALEHLAVVSQQKIIAHEDLVKYDKVLQNPNSSIEDIRDAATDFLK